MTDKPVVAHTYLDDVDIHEFVFANASRIATDKYIAIVQEIYPQYIKGKPNVLFIIDIHMSGMIPLKYASLMTEKISQTLSPFPKTYIAYLSDNKSDQMFISTLSYTIKSEINRQLFSVNDRDKAIEWLLAKRANS